MTREIDHLSQQNQLYSSACTSTYFSSKSQLQHTIIEERARYTPAQESLRKITVMVMSDPANPPTIQWFSFVLQLLKSVNYALYDVNEEKHPEKCSFQFR